MTGAQSRGLEPRRITLDRVDHQIRDVLLVRVPGAAIGRSGATCWQNRLATCLPSGARLSSITEGSASRRSGLSTSMRARIVERAIHVSETRRHDDSRGQMSPASGRHENRGNAASATFIRNVPDRSDSGSCVRQNLPATRRVDKRAKQKFRIEVRNNGTRAKRSACHGDDASRAPFDDTRTPLFAYEFGRRRRGTRQPSLR